MSNLDYQLSNFAHELETIIGNPTQMRPFICNGSPLACEAFIVGLNPATTLHHSFWDFWHPTYGYRKAEWLEAYKQERREIPLTAGRKRRNAISNTRRVIESIIATADPIAILETNLYATPTERIADLPAHARSTSVICYLLRTIRPKALLVHGKETLRYFNTTFGVDLVRDEPATIKLDWGEPHILVVSHLSRGWSKERVHAQGIQLRQMCEE